MAICAGGVFDVVIVGGGIAGNALATVLARAGKAVLVLERSFAYRDQVRGEYVQPWGVAEALRLGLHDTLLGAGGAHHTRLVPYDETTEPAEAEAAAVALDAIIPGVRGTLGVGHPAACEALAAAAVSTGAQLLRCVEIVAVQHSPSPLVRFRWNGKEQEVRCRLVVGADGRQSAVRHRAGIPLHSTKPRLLGAGLLVEGLRDWPEHQVTIGSEVDRVFFVVPQAAGRARLYLMYPPDQQQRFSGPRASRTFLDGFALACIPTSDGIVQAKPAGPCATYPMNDTWTDSPVAEGLVLIGDAAGYSDPHIGQGLSVALPDVRILSDLLLTSEDWSAHALGPYAEERSERMQRLRSCNDVATSLRGEFGAEARARRRRARELMQAEPELALWRWAAWAGPEAAPASAFTSRVRQQLLDMSGQLRT